MRHWKEKLVPIKTGHLANYVGSGLRWPWQMNKYMEIPNGISWLQNARDKLEQFCCCRKIFFLEIFDSRKQLNCAEDNSKQTEIYFPASKFSYSGQGLSTLQILTIKRLDDIDHVKCCSLAEEMGSVWRLFCYCNLLLSEELI